MEITKNTIKDEIGFVPTDNYFDTFRYPKDGDQWVCVYFDEKAKADVSLVRAGSDDSVIYVWNCHTIQDLKDLIRIVI